MISSPKPPTTFSALIQGHADEVEFLYASLGEDADYLGHAAQIEAQLGQDKPSALRPGDPAL